MQGEKEMKRRKTAISVTLLIVLLLGAVASIPVLAQGPVEIDVYTVAWSAPHQAMMAQLIDQFNQENDGQIKANYIQGDWGEGDTYIAAGVAGGGGIACVIEWWTGGAQAWFNQGFTIDMGPYMTQEDWATMPDFFWASRETPDGKVFSSGTVAYSPGLIYYNPALLEAAGIKAPTLADGPWTWDQFMDAARALTVDAKGNNLRDNPDAFDKNNVVQWGFLPRYDTEKVWEDTAAVALQSSGKPIIRQLEDGTWDAVFDEEALAPMASFLGMVRAGVTPDLAVGLTGETQDQAFVQGLAAMVPRGFFNVPVLRSVYPDFKFSVMLEPAPANSKYYTDNSGQGFAVPVTCEHPAEAVKFAMWMQQAGPNALDASALDLVPVNPTAMDESVIADNPDWDPIRYYQSNLEIVTVPVNDHQGEFTEVLWVPTMLRYVQGEIDFSEAVSIIQKGAKDILNQ
jgi:ABC-type glycerol-3-phosphate transport system substrate-binding protein